jgi:hypothetical protein|tara:strand:- start:59 stop:325 length:267 start_codon:yes stop_codon:yes gene_type:complete
MTSITIELSDTEYLAMEVIAMSPEDWADNVVRNRARVSIEKICEILMSHCNENGIAIAVGKEAQVAQAVDLDLVNKAADLVESGVPPL